MRINKYIAHSGFCSRRQAEEYIKQGKVKVNHQIITDLAYQTKDSDVVLIDEKNISPKQAKPIILLFHKPVGVICSHNDPQKRQTIFEGLPKDFQNFISVGRLDYNSEGLIILTNNRTICNYLEHPKNQQSRIYHLKIFGNLNIKKLNIITQEGVTIEGIKYAPFAYKILKSSGKNHWLELELAEGKNREIRNIVKFLNLRVSRLIRMSYSDFTLGDIPKGRYIKVSDIVTQQLLTEI
jgi:23S rRNA pseudouridine2605 synthase